MQGPLTRLGSEMVVADFMYSGGRGWNWEAISFDLPQGIKDKIRAIPCQQVGMATGRVRAGFFHTQTRPAGQDPRSEPDPFTKWVFFPGPGPTPVGLRGPRPARPNLGLILGPNHGPITINFFSRPRCQK